MNNLRSARRGAVALISVATLVLLASCISGQTDLHDSATGGAASTVTGSGGTQANSTGGSSVQGTTGGQLANGGSLSSTGGTGTTTTGGVSTATGGGAGAPETGGSGAGGSNGGTSSNTGGSTSSCSDLPPNNGDTCAHAVEFGWCTQSWLGTSCQRSCGKCNGATGTGGSGTGTTGGSSSTGGSTASTGGSNGNVNQPPPITGGSQAWASRYWDCCKPACGWKANVRSGNPMMACNQQNQSLGGSYDTKNACEGGGSAYMCWSGAPWSVSDTLSYGFAAASGGNYVCGRCFQIQFSGTGHNGSNPGAVSLNGKTMIVQVINNGGVANDQFDILIPGGGVGALNACSTQWGSSDLGSQYGGFLAGCSGDKNCVKQKCQTVFAGKAELLAGCDWFLGWYNAADNPNFIYKQIACPSAITQRSGLGDPG